MIYFIRDKSDSATNHFPACVVRADSPERAVHLAGKAAKINPNGYNLAIEGRQDGPWWTRGKNKVLFSAEKAIRR